MRVRRLLAALVSVLLAAALVGISSSSIRAAAPARQRASLQLNATQVETGRPVTATGRLRPARKGRMVRLQVRMGGQWTTLDRDRESRTGKVAFATSLATPGAYPVRLRAKKVEGLRPVTSRVRILTVVPGAASPREGGTLVPLLVGGVVPNASVERADVSADGRYVAIATAATNLTPDETDGVVDVFWADQATGVVRKVSRPWTSGAPANGPSTAVSMSADGQRLVYQTWSSGITPTDNNGRPDVVWWNALTDRNVRLSTAAAQPGRPSANGDSMDPRMSADGSTVAFMSTAGDLVAEPTTGLSTYVVDLAGGAVSLLARGYDGRPASGVVGNPALSATGRYVAVLTNARNLLPEMATAEAYDVVWFDRTTGERRWVTRVPDDARVVHSPEISPDGSRVALSARMGAAGQAVVSDVLLWRREDPLDRLSRLSRSPSGLGGDGNSTDPVFSADGQRVLFASEALNLVPGAPQGRQNLFSTDLASGRVELLTGPEAGVVLGGKAVVWAAPSGLVVVGLAVDPARPGALTAHLWHPCSKEYPC